MNRPSHVFDMQRATSSVSNFNVNILNNDVYFILFQKRLQIVRRAAEIQRLVSLTGC